MPPPTIPTKRAHVLPEDLTTGAMVPFDIEDPYGKLLLGRGQVVRTEEQRKRLLQIGRKPYHVAVKRPQSGGVSRRRNDADAPFLNPFDELYQVALSLQETFKWLDRGNGRFARRIDLLTSRIGDLVERDADASIGAAHLDDEFPYSIRHPIRQAILCDTVATRMGIPEAERRSIVCAALTANAGMLELQDDLDKQKQPLDEIQRLALDTHPRRAVERLLAEGIEDRLWLRVVAEHHERLDGSGYPEGLKGSQICRGACLLMIVDTYMAMTTNRTYRAATAIREALLELLDLSGVVYDRDTLSGFISTVGIYPPGCYVSLDSGERGIVTHRGKRGADPVVAVIVKKNGQTTARPLFRDTSLPNAPDVAALEPFSGLPRRFHLASLWGYEN